VTALQKASGGDTSLFRPEVLEERKSEWLGTVLLAPRLSYRLFVIFAACAAAAVLGLLFFADYTRKARVEGRLVPETGVARLFAPRAGRVAALYVREGMRVERGAPIALVSSEVDSAVAGSTGEEVVRQLTRRRDSMTAEQARRRELQAQRADELRQRLATLNGEEAALEREMQIQADRARLAARGAERFRGLLRRGLVTATRAEQAEQDSLAQALQLQALLRSRAGLRRERLAIETELSTLPLRGEDEVAAISRDAAALEQQLAEAEAQREVVVRAPSSGIVTALQVTPGGAVSPDSPLLSIVPAGGKLEAQLFSPSRSIGFVRPGQTVLLRYDAYPYQKFGYHRGTVTSVSRAPLTPAELAQEMPSAAEASSAEPLYRITVRPERQAVLGDGAHYPLQPGMQLEGDVLLERRRLIEWLLGPVRALGR